MVFVRVRARHVAHLCFVAILGAIIAVSALPLQAQTTTETTAEVATDETPAPRGTNLSLGAFKVSADMPIEVVSDELQMDQNISTAIFKGNVLVEHGDLTLNCATVLVEYGTPEGSTKSNQIIRITATGDVKMTSPTETAESDKAVYTLATRQVVMTDNVVVTQGPNTVSGERMVVSLDDGTAVMQGRVRTTIGTGKQQDATPEGAGEDAADASADASTEGSSQ
jgi:lipopolysaccharide export system protein LptA